MTRPYRIAAWPLSWVVLCIVLEPNPAGASYRYSGSAPTPQERLQQEMQAMAYDLVANINEAASTYAWDSLTAEQNAEIFGPEAVQDQLDEDQADIDAAKGTADGFLDFMTDMSLGAHLRFAPFQDGTTGGGGDGQDPSAYYPLGNQASFGVQLGPVGLRFAGARAGLSIAANISSSTNPGYPAWISVFSGWLPDMSVDLGTPKIRPMWDARAVLKGDLYVDVYLTSAVNCTGATRDSPGHCDDNYVYRYRYIDEAGLPHFFLQRPVETNVLSHSGGTYDPLPTQYWSTDGQMALDLSQPCLPVLRRPDGSVEEFHAALAGFGWDGPNMHSSTLFTWFDAPPNPAALGTGCDAAATLRRVDRNGNASTFTYPDALTRTVQDPRGRITTAKFTAPTTVNWWSSPNPQPATMSLLASVTVAGPGNAPQVYTVHWTTVPVIAGGGTNSSGPITPTAFGDITLTCAAGTLCPLGTTQNVDVIQSITMPDGRSYAFQYGPWGNLTRIATPDGAVTRYQYGAGGSNSTYAAAALPLVSPTLSFDALSWSTSTTPPTPWSPAIQTFQGYGVTSESTFPAGDAAGQPAYATTTSYSQVNLGGCTPDLSGAATSGPPCCVQVWQTLTFPDGSQHKAGRCAASPHYAGTAGDGVVPHGLLIGEEIWAAGASAPMSATYNGDPATGQLSYAYEIGPLTAPQHGNTAGGVWPLDHRVTAVKHVADGFVTTTTTTYGDVIDLGSTTLRNTGNKTAECLWLGSATSCTSGTGTRLQETDNSFHHDANYAAHNQLRLLTGIVVKDGAGAVWGRKAIGFDELALGPSGQPGLDATYTDAYRGNPTTTTGYTDAAAGTGPVVKRSYYFDNGVIQKTQNPNDIAANRFTTSVTGFDFGACATSPKITTTVQNALGQSVSTVTECYSELVISSVGLNGERTCHQLDGLGRPVETAGPGDTLSALPLCSASSTSLAGCYVRDTTCSATGTVVGNGGAGPTTWTEYFPFGLAGVGYGQARVVTHTKDGSASGSYDKVFSDAMARPTASCHNIDPGRTAGAGTNNEVCTYASYDAMGRVMRQYSPYFASNLTTAAEPPAGQYSETLYDAIGRMTTSRLVWSTGNATTTLSYSSSGNTRVTTQINANGNATQTFSNALNQVVETDSYRCATSPCPVGSGTKLATMMAYDGAGRLTTTTDPAGNVLTLGYDGLSRRTSMTDPDMGHWTYGYDGDGNLTQQTDAKQQTIAMYYDALDRVVVKDLPPAGPGAEDELDTYDGVLPTCAALPCAASWTGTSTALCCDDHDATTVDTCLPATVTCQNVPSTCLAPGACTPSSTRTVSCGDCGTETDTCNAACQWVAGACTSQGVCAPGATRSSGCGNCGTETDTCSASCQWTAGSCLGQGVCAPSATRTVGCGNCGSETDTCSASCQWTAGACTGQGVCAPSTTRSIACGDCGNETDTCSSSCQWAAGSCVGNTALSQACDPLGICDSCSGSCNMGSQSCQANGTWGGCSGAFCSPGGGDNCGVFPNPPCP